MFQHARKGAVDAISGDSPIEKSSVEELRDIVEPCLADGQPRIVLDLSSVPFLDSAGLEYLLDVHETCIRRGGQLRLAAPSALCRDILDVCDVSEVIEVCPDVMTAVGGFAR